ncbi:UNVERIFIED_CONTAM: hypothetical protein FKN15_065034 [Acipenser sinensis]
MRTAGDDPFDILIVGIPAVLRGGRTARLALYVYEYLLHVGAQKSAQTFLSEGESCRQGSAGSRPGCAKLLVFAGIGCGAPVVPVQGQWITYPCSCVYAECSSPGWHVETTQSKQAANLLQTPARLRVFNPDPVSSRSVFWDLYCAAPDRRETCEHSSEAKAFHDYSAAAAPSPVMGNMPPNDGMPGGPMPPGFFQSAAAAPSPVMGNMPPNDGMPGGPMPPGFFQGPPGSQPSPHAQPPPHNPSNPMMGPHSQAPGPVVKCITDLQYPVQMG